MHPHEKKSSGFKLVEHGGQDDWTPMDNPYVQKWLNTFGVNRNEGCCCAEAKYPCKH
jgi:hypothetical protein